MTATRLVRRTVGNREHLCLMVPVTPLDRLPRETEWHGNSPLDALTNFCDEHAWRVGSYSPWADPPQPIGAIIHASDDIGERVDVVVTPIEIASEQISKTRYMRHVGVYRITLEG